MLFFSHQNASVGVIAELVYYFDILCIDAEFKTFFIIRYHTTNFICLIKLKNFQYTIF